MKSIEFLDTILKELQKMWSNQISEVIDYMKTIRDDIPHFRVFEAIDNSGAFAISFLFVYCLQDQITCLSKSTGTSNWCFVDSHVFSATESYFKQISKKSIVSNVLLNPVIVEEDAKLDKLGLPIHIPLIKSRTVNNSLPELVFYLDISLNNTSVVYNSVDNNGIIVKQFGIDGSYFTSSLSSISNFFELEFGIQINNNNKSLLQLLEYKFTDTTSKTTTMEKMARFLVGSSTKRNGINNSSKSTQIRSYVANYLRTLIDDINLQLKATNIDEEKVRYVLCMEKIIMETLNISSRNELLDLIKENCIVDFTDNPRKLIVVDQGEREVRRKLDNNWLDARTYYAHAHISGTHIYFKLKEVVDITESNRGIPESSTIYIKDELVVIDNVYEQVADTLWNHIQLLDEVQREAFICNYDNKKQFYLAYKVQLKKFIAQELFYNQVVQDYSDLVERVHVIELLNNTRLTLTLQQLLDIAILPVLRKTISIVTSCLLDKNAFGYFEISRLYITGGFLKTYAYNDIYHWFIISEMEKELKSQIREKTYKTE